MYASGFTGLLRQTTFIPIRAIDWIAILCASTVLQRAGAVLQHRSGGPEQLEQYLVTFFMGHSVVEIIM